MGFKLKDRVGEVSILGEVLVKNPGRDEDWKSKGYEIKFKGFLAEGDYKLFEIFIDDKKIPPDRAEIGISDVYMRLDQVNHKNPLTIMPGNRIVLRLHPDFKLGKKHRLCLRAQPLQVSVPGGVEFWIKLVK